MSPEAAYAVCLRLARSHYENFPVASWLMPAPVRPHVAAVYTFARLADDFADEGDSPEPVRLARLDQWESRLTDAGQGLVLESGDDTHDAVFVALRETLRRRADGQRERLVQELANLLSAFRQDVVQSRYDTWDGLLDYCRRSANPVGRIVLLLCGYSGAALERQSDNVCTALQLTNFWQDLLVDWGRGRLYVPREIVEAHRAHPGDLGRPVWSPQWRDALRDVGERTRLLFEAGRGVADGVTGRLRWELRATWLGGRRVLDRLAEADYDVSQGRPTLSRRDVPSIVMGTIAWRRTSTP